MLYIYLKNTHNITKNQQDLAVQLVEHQIHYDKNVLDLPQYSFMLKLTELTNNSEACLTWYRSTLTSRANSLQGCST